MKPAGQRQLTDIDNSGKGNCGYYAYSISLMYYLRYQKSPDKTNHIFKTLGLEERDKSELLTIINQEKIVPFTPEQTTLIESTLGSATRRLMARHTKESFLKSPKDSSLFADAAGGLNRLIMACVAKKLKTFIEDYVEVDTKLTAKIKEEYKKDNIDYPTLLKNIKSAYLEQRIPKAEIYNVSDMIKRMKNYADKVTEQLITDYKQKKVNSQQEQRFIDSDLDQLLNQLIIKFFTNNNNKNLDAYIDHIAEPYRWATTDNIFMLHEAVQGEEKTRNKEKKVTIDYKCPIALTIYADRTFVSGDTENIELAINNIANVHWISIVPRAMVEDAQKSTNESICEQQRRLYNNTSFQAQFLRLVGQDKFRFIQNHAYQLRNTLEEARLSSDEKEEIYECAYNYINSPDDPESQSCYQSKVQTLIAQGGNYRGPGCALFVLGVITLAVGIMASIASLGALAPLSGLLTIAGAAIALSGTGSSIYGFFNPHYSFGKKMESLDRANQDLSSTDAPVLARKQL